MQGEDKFHSEMVDKEGFLEEGGFWSNLESRRKGYEMSVIFQIWNVGWEKAQEIVERKLSKTDFN